MGSTHLTRPCCVTSSRSRRQKAGKVMGDRSGSTASLGPMLTCARSGGRWTSRGDPVSRFASRPEIVVMCSGSRVSTHQIRGFPSHDGKGVAVWCRDPGDNGNVVFDPDGESALFIECRQSHRRTRSLRSTTPARWSPQSPRNELVRVRQRGRRGSRPQHGMPSSFADG